MNSLGQVFGKGLVRMASLCSMKKARGYLGEAGAGIIPRLICFHAWLLGWEDSHEDSQLEYWIVTSPGGLRELALLYDDLRFQKPVSQQARGKLHSLFWPNLASLTASLLWLSIGYNELLGLAQIQEEGIQIITSEWQECQQNDRCTFMLWYHPCSGAGRMILSLGFTPFPGWHFLGRPSGRNKTYDGSRIFFPKCYYLPLGVKNNSDQHQKPSAEHSAEPGTWGAR